MQRRIDQEGIQMAQNAKAKSAGVTERTEAIISSACHAFLAHGYEGTSMDLVAAEAGVTKKTVYNHFPSKEALFNAVSASFCAEVVAAIDLEQVATGNVQADLEHFCRKFIETLVTPPGLEIYRLAIGQGRRFPEFGRALSQVGVNGLEAALVNYLERLNASGELQIEDVTNVAEYLLGSMLVVVHRALFGVETDPRSPDTNHFIHGAVAAFCRAYAVNNADVK